ncbi:MAG: HAMP domain-containing histidine kinase [Spirochaetales bacterium]|nr:HAMP domain-containing histidine kinase [Spirochaetales bacterium]
MNTVFIRTLLPIFITFLFLILILWILFNTGLMFSIADWNRIQGEMLSEQLHSLLSDIYDHQPEPDYEDIFPAVQSLLPGDGFLVIVDRDKNPLFVFRNHNPESGQKNQLLWALNYQNRHKKEITYIDLDPAGFFFFGEVGFNKTRGNRRLLSTINLTFTAGILISAVLSFLFAFFFSRSLSNRALELMKGIKAIAAGHLDYHINETGPRELGMIAKSANFLGKKLKEEGEMRSRWTEDITHDLRTPLSALRAQLEGIKDGILDGKPGRLSMILEELGRIETLVNDFNQLMKLESPEMTIQKESIPVRGFLDELVRMYFLSAEEKKVTITAHSGITEFTGDKHLLFRAVSNLISNAVRYADTGGRVHLAVSGEYDRITLSVFNTGKAIPAEEIPFVFDRLYRGEYARNTKGSGLGLSITKRIAELHGGVVGMTSGEHTGTTVSISFPGRFS